MKIVTMCQGGNVRSVGMGFVLKYGFGHDTLACGWEKNSLETREMLFNWADKIFVMQDEFVQYVPDKFKNKIIVTEIGTDRWGNSLHQDLLSICNNICEQMRAKNLL